MGHDDAAGAGVEGVVDEVGRVAWNTNVGDHGAVGVVLDRFDEAREQGRAQRGVLLSIPASG